MSVLLVNADLEPITMINWQKAVIMYLLNKVDIHEHNGQLIRSTNLSIPKPTIVKLKSYVYIKFSPRYSKTNIFIRDDFQCQYCGEELNRKEATIDHIIPKSQGGAKNWLNIVTCCKECNLKKADRTPEEAGMALLNKPKQLLTKKIT